MDFITQTYPHLAGYYPAILAMAVLSLAVLAQSFLAGVLGLAGGEEVAGMPLRGDHSKRSFRVLRTYGNSTENLPVMIVTAGLAVLAGVGAVLVNWLVALHVLFRLAYWAVYYSGVGKVAGGARTITYVAGFLMNAILAVITFVALLL